MTVTSPDLGGIGIKVKLSGTMTVPVRETTVSYKLKITPNALIGFRDAVFKGRDETGRHRSVAIRLQVL